MNMLTLFEYLWGVLCGAIIGSAVTVIYLARRARHEHTHTWACPVCPFVVMGTDQGLVDYVTLEHSESHG